MLGLKSIPVRKGDTGRQQSEKDAEIPIELEGLLVIFVRLCVFPHSLSFSGRSNICSTMVLNGTQCL